MTSKRQSLSIQVEKSVLEAVESGTSNHSNYYAVLKLTERTFDKYCNKIKQSHISDFFIMIIMIRFVVEKVLVEILVEILKINKHIYIKFLHLKF